MQSMVAKIEITLYLLLKLLDEKFVFFSPISYEKIDSLVCKSIIVIIRYIMYR